MERLETERLRLRELQATDVDALFAVWGDPETMRHFPMSFSREQVAGIIERNRERYRKLGFGWWAVVIKATGEMIGDCGLMVAEVEGRTELEIGYHLHRAHWGRGYATEAAKACLDWAFRHTDYERVVSFMGLDNLASQRVAAKVHRWRADWTFERAGIEHCLYGTTREEYLAAAGLAGVFRGE